MDLLLELLLVLLLLLLLYVLYHVDIGGHEAPLRPGPSYNPYRSARTGPSDASEPGRSSAALERTFLALTGSLAPTLKKIAELRV